MMSDAAAVAIVTGGAQGIGAAICVALLDKGYKVCVADIQGDKGENYVDELGEKFGSGNVTFSLCDVTKEEDLKRTFEHTIEVFKKVDVLVCNAGVSQDDPRKCLEVNVLGPVIGCNMAMKYMGKSSGGKGGIVIATASLAGISTRRAHIIPVYAATKHAVVGLIRSYGKPLYLEKEGIIFAAVCPGVTDTQLLRSSPRYKSVLEHTYMSAEYVAQGFMKILEDRINGSTLMITKDRGYEYVNEPDI